MVAKNYYDAAVVGGGPVGSRVASRLAGAGYRVAVLEKKETLDSPVCCTGIVSKRCVEHYNIPDSVIYRWSNSAAIFSPTHNCIHVYREQPQAAILDRTAFNRHYARQALESGADFMLGREVRNVRFEANGVCLDILKCEPVRAKVTIITTGFGSRLIDGLGLRGADDFVMGAQAEIEITNTEEVEVYFGKRIAPGFFAWLVPTTKNKALAGLLTRRNPPAYLKSLLSSLAVEGKIESSEVPLTFGGVTLKPLARTYDDNLLVVGTAAGQVKPMTGGGLYFGLLCADIAADTIDKSLKSGDFSAKQLSGYERTWKRRLIKEIRTGYLARRIFEMMNDRQLERVFGIMTSAGLIDELQNAEQITFDSHAAVIGRILSQKLLSKTIQSMKTPFRLNNGVLKSG